MEPTRQPVRLTQARQIDDICNRFEADWLAGKTPQLRAVVESVDEGLQAGLLRALLPVELELLAREGKPPVEAGYKSRFPAHTQVITEVFAELAAQRGEAASRDTAVSGSSVRTPDRASPPTAEYLGSRAGTARSTPPQKIGRFEVLSVLGEGAFGKVYRARDPKLDREVAIKVPLPGVVVSERDLQRLMGEAKAAATIQHPNICPVYEVGQDGDTHYIVMAYVPGQSLAELLRARKAPMPPRQAALVVRKLALALETAHSKGVIHRDLKPGNILFDKDRKEMVITDFGLARRVRKDEARLTQSGVIMGTPAYMAPEQARGNAKSVGPCSDVYSLGVILYELLTGRRPFNGSVAEVIGDVLHVEPEPLSKHRRDLDPALETICLNAMAKKTDERYGSMKEFADALNDYLKGTAPSEGKSVASVPSSAGTVARQEAELLRELSREHREETKKAVKEAIKGARVPFWAWLAGSGLTGVLVLLGILFFVRGGSATVIINVPLPKDIDLKDTTLSFFLDGKEIAAEELEKPIELKPGDHELLIKRGEQVVKRMKFTVSVKGKDVSVEVKEVTEPPPTDPGFTNSLGMEFVRVPMGKFLMGGGSGTVGATEVTIEQDFYLGKYEVTQREWEAVTGVNPSHYRREGPGRDSVANVSNEDLKRFPVEWVGWDDVQLFLEALNKRVKETGWVYRLPTEAEWEYACRGGPSDDKLSYAFDYYLDKPVNTLQPDQANCTFEGKGLMRTCKVGSYKPNRLGLYDMHGNILEWCNDIQKANEDERKELEVTEGRVTRGGGWLQSSHACRAATRSWYPEKGSHTSGRRPFLGLRLARVPAGKAEEAGWQTLFNGKDLDGWEVDGDKEGWTVKDGAIATVPDVRHRGWLYTRKEYDDFELLFEFAATTNANSGIAVRGAPGEGAGNKLQLEVQVRDEGLAPDQHVTGSVIYTGIDSNGPPKPPKQKPLGEWNEMRITARGSVLKIEVNGAIAHEVDLDKIDPASIKGDKEWGPKNLKRRRGRIGLQYASKEMKFRNIRVKELKAGNTPADGAWQPLFNGKDLTGWAGLTQFWKYQDDQLIGSSFPGGVKHDTFLVSTKKYRDFELRCQVKLKDGKGDTGIQIQSLVVDSAKYTVQGPQADFGEKNWGSLYGQRLNGMMKQAPEAVVNRVIRPNDFNDLSVRCVGKHVTIQLNGETTVDDDFSNLSEEGIIGWQIHAGQPMEVTFRNMHIRELKADTAPPAVDRDRAAAEWFHGIGGAVRIRSEGRDFNVNKDGTLPKEPFKILKFYCDPDKNLTDQAMRERLTGLTEVEFFDTGARIDGTGFACFKDNPRPIGFELMKAPITDDGLKAIGQIPQLEAIFTDSSLITDGGLAHLSKHSEMARLGLFCPQITDVGFAHLKGLTNVHGLNLSRTQIGDDSLAWLVNWKGVDILTLKFTRVTDAGMKHVVKIPALRHLDLSHTSLGDVGLEQLQQAKNLQILHIQNTKVTDAGVKKFKEAKPACQVER